MRRFFNIFCLALLSSVLALTSTAIAGGQKHSSNQGNNSHNNQNRSNQNQNNQIQTRKLPLFQQGNKLTAGNKNGMGFIADPARRNLASKTNTTPKSNAVPKLNTGNVTAIMDPYKPANPTRVVPVVRDHTLPNPNATIPPYRPRYNSINGGGFGIDLNPFDFKAPRQFNHLVDMRTNPYPGSGRSGGHKQPWTPNTSGPANRSPVKP